VLVGTCPSGLGQFISHVPESRVETKTVIFLSSPQYKTNLFSEPMTLTATVSKLSQETEEPSGKVVFMDGSTPIKNGSDINSEGQAILDTSSLSSGSHSIIARYSGNDKFRPSTSSPIPFTIKDPEKTSLDKIVGIFASLIILITAVINFISSYVNNIRK
jgi:hypothetical protein